jgi:hypothetical protein
LWLAALRKLSVRGKACAADGRKIPKRPVTVHGYGRGWNFDPLARDVLIWLEQSGLKEATFIGVPAVMLPRKALIPIVSAAAETATQRVTSRAQVKTRCHSSLGFRTKPANPVRAPRGQLSASTQVRVLQVPASVGDRASGSQSSNTLQPFVGSAVRFLTRHSPRLPSRTFKK